MPFPHIKVWAGVFGADQRLIRQLDRTLLLQCAKPAHMHFYCQLANSPAGVAAAAPQQAAKRGATAPALAYSDQANGPSAAQQSMRLKLAAASAPAHGQSENNRTIAQLRQEDRLPKQRDPNDTIPQQRKRTPSIPEQRVLDSSFPPQRQQPEKTPPQRKVPENPLKAPAPAVPPSAWPHIAHAGAYAARISYSGGYGAHGPTSAAYAPEQRSESSPVLSRLDATQAAAYGPVPAPEQATAALQVGAPGITSGSEVPAAVPGKSVNFALPETLADSILEKQQQGPPAQAPKAKQLTGGQEALKELLAEAAAAPAQYTPEAPASRYAQQNGLRGHFQVWPAHGQCEGYYHVRAVPDEVSQGPASLAHINTASR